MHPIPARTLEVRGVGGPAVTRSAAKLQARREQQRTPTQEHNPPGLQAPPGWQSDAEESAITGLAVAIASAEPGAEES